MSASFFSQKKIVGNGCENGALVRLLPSNDPGIIELDSTPVHIESTTYLDLKIYEHRHRFQEVFPDGDLIPKHYYLEQYPALMDSFDQLLLSGQ